MFEKITVIIFASLEPLQEELKNSAFGASGGVAIFYRKVPAQWHPPLLNSKIISAFVVKGRGARKLCRLMKRDSEIFFAINSIAAQVFADTMHGLIPGITCPDK